MIYNFSSFVDGEFKLVFKAIDLKEARKVSPDDWKPKADREYFVVGVTNQHLVDPDNRYQHPSADDVFIFGDLTYGLDHVLDSSRRGASWIFSLLTHRLVKTVYGAPKSFGVTYKEQ